MKTLVVYDSTYGNTKLIAEAIADTCKARLIQVNDVRQADLEALDLLIVGSPTHGGRPTEETQAFLDNLPTLKGLKVTAFDTRLTMEWVKMFGFAAGKIADNLQKNGGKLVIAPAGFIVSHKKGPLLDNELDRARAWAQKIRDLEL